ncbi:MAG: gliding motility-associated C-terminal domain-containing protein, partial [Bacteroidales bacterium]|nr:gliding motility-associated C-terminal domain-containing protein [Bacteroidales bacterium]
IEIIDDYDENYIDITSTYGGIDDGNQLIYTLPDLAPGASASFSYDAKLKVKTLFLAGITTVSNTATITCAETEIDLSDNSSTYDLEVTLLPDLNLHLSVSDEPATVGQPLTFTIIITNIGNYRSENLQINCYLPDGFLFDSASDGGLLSGYTITWPIVPTMHVIDTLNYSFIVVPECASTPSASTTAQVSNTILETDYSNNVATVLSNIENDFLFIDCPLDIYIPMEAGFCGAHVTFTDPTATDDCGGLISVSRTDTSGLISGDLFPEGNTSIIYSATNSIGETISCSFVVSVGPDLIPPIIHNVPENVTLECSDCIQAFENNDFESPILTGSWGSIPAPNISGWNTTAVDNRIELQKSGGVDGVLSYSGNQHAELNGNNVGDFYQEFCTVPTTTVQISFAHHKRMAAINTSDDIMEVLTGPDLSNLTSLGLFVATSTSGWTVHTVDFPIPIGQISTLFVFRAVQGAPDNTTYGNLIDDINVITLFDASSIPYATDNCALDHFSLHEEKIDGSCLNDYRINRTWTAVDVAGNTSVAAQTVIVGDVIGPDFTLPPDITISCDADPNDLGITGNATNLYDNCDPAPTDLSFIDQITAGRCINQYTIERTWTLIDHCSNATSKTQKITVSDTSPPVFNEPLPTDITVVCGTSIPIPNLTATDNCSASIVTFSEGVVAGTCANTYQLIRTWTASDACGNTRIHSQIILYEDLIIPVWETPIGSLDRTVECSSPDDYNDAMTLKPVASDNCSSLTMNELPESISVCTGTYTITRKWIATDECGNASGEFVQVITVEDTTPPTLLTPASNKTVECDGAGNTSDLNNWLNANGGASAVDNCSDADWTNDFSSLSDLCAETGSVTVIFTAKDNCGNHVSTTASFTIIDATPPDLSSPAADLTVECDGTGNSTDLTNWLNANGGASANDRCGTIVWTNDFSSLSDLCAETGTAAVTFTATDDCGNKTYTTASFTIADSNPPTLSSAASDLNVECDGAGNSSELTNWLNLNGGATAIDDCGTITWSNNFTSLSDLCAETGTATVTFTAKDECGNETNTTANFTIIDSTQPTWNESVGSLDRSVECSSSAELNNALALSPTASENCGVASITENPEIIGVCSGTYTITRTWKAFDECGNESSIFSQIINVSDHTAPIISTAALDRIVECDGRGNNDELKAWLLANGGAQAFDYCSDIEWTNDFSSLSNLCAETGIALVTFTATDNCGNFVNTSASFKIVDSTPPALTSASSDLIVECDGLGNVNEINDWLNSNAGADANDNCGTITWSNNYNNLSDLCATTGSATVLFTATDDCGNQLHTSSKIQIIDTKPPIWSTELGSLDKTLNCDDAEGLRLALESAPIATDICGSATLNASIEEIEATTCPNSFTLKRSWTASDACGNESIAFIQYIQISDQEPPLSKDLESVYLNCNATDEWNAALTLRPSFTDNCTPQMAIQVNLIEDITDYTCPNTFVRTRIWEGIDLCGNASKSSLQIYVTDTSAPTSDPLPDLFFSCKSEISEANTDDLKNIIDNCSSTIERVFVSDISDGNSCPETIIRTYKLIDECTNERIVKQTILILDTIPPTADAPADQTVKRLEDVPSPSINSIENVFDNCSLNPTVTFISSQLNSDASPPFYTYLFWIEDDCGNKTEISQRIYINDFPVAKDDYYTIDENSSENIFPVLINDFFGFDGPQIPSLNFLSMPAFGNLVLHDNGTSQNPLDDFFVYTPIRNNYKTDQFVYSITDRTGDISDATVEISFTPNPLHIPEAFSPNGDGVNEFFHIRGLYYYPNNSIIIYDEHGNKVFESDPYQNNWDGSNHFSDPSREELAQATYFYILSLGDGKKPIKGYVYINRLKGN